MLLIGAFSEDEFDSHFVQRQDISEMSSCYFNSQIASYSTDKGNDFRFVRLETILDGSSYR